MCLPFCHHKGEDLRQSLQLLIRRVFFCSSAFLMSIFCEKSGCFTLPGGVCMCAYVYVSDEVFGNRRAGLIITDISLDAFRPRSSWERSVMPPDPDVKQKR